MKKTIVLLLLLAACQLQPFEQSRQPLPTVYTGTQGVEIVPFPDMANQVYVGQQANFVFELNNGGVANVRDGHFSFILENEYVSASPLQETGSFSLNGKSAYNPQGDYTRLMLQTQIKDLPPQQEAYPTQVLLQACYPYKTYASAQICIDPDIANVNPRKSCYAQPVSMGGGQGSPVAVTRVEPVMAPEGNDVRPVIAIYLQNLGTGQVVGRNSLSAVCGGRGKADFDLVDISVSLQDEQLTCSPAPIHLRKGEEARVICESQRHFGMASGTFTTILSVELDYGYMNTASFPFTITRLY